VKRGRGLRTKRVIEIYTKRKEEQKATTTIFEQAHNSYFTKTVTPSVRYYALKTFSFSLSDTLSVFIWTYAPSGALEDPFLK